MIKIGSTSTLVSDYVVLFSKDPAIDQEAEGFGDIWEEYLKTGDHEKIPIKPGAAPTLFRLKHLRGYAKRQLLQKIGSTVTESGLPSGAGVFLAAQVCLLGIENLSDTEGKSFFVDTKYSKEYKTQIIADDTMDFLDDIEDGELVNELGVRAILAVAPSPL